MEENIERPLNDPYLRRYTAIFILVGNTLLSLLFLEHGGTIEGLLYDARLIEANGMSPVVAMKLQYAWMTITDWTLQHPYVRVMYSALLSWGLTHDAVLLQVPWMISSFLETAAQLILVMASFWIMILNREPFTVPHILSIILQLILIQLYSGLWTLVTLWTFQSSVEELMGIMTEIRGPTLFVTYDPNTQRMTAHQIRPPLQRRMEPLREDSEGPSLATPAPGPAYIPYSRPRRSSEGFTRGPEVELTPESSSEGSISEEEEDHDIEELDLDESEHPKERRDFQTRDDTQRQKEISDAVGKGETEAEELKSQKQRGEDDEETEVISDEETEVISDEEPPVMTELEKVSEEGTMPFGEPEFYSDDVLHTTPGEDHESALPSEAGISDKVISDEEPPVMTELEKVSEEGTMPFGEPEFYSHDVLQTTPGEDHESALPSEAGISELDAEEKWPGPDSEASERDAIGTALGPSGEDIPKDGAGVTVETQRNGMTEDQKRDLGKDAKRTSEEKLTTTRRLKQGKCRKTKTIQQQPQPKGGRCPERCTCPPGNACKSYNKSLKEKPEISGLTNTKVDKDDQDISKRDKVPEAATSGPVENTNDSSTAKTSEDPDSTTVASGQQSDLIDAKKAQTSHPDDEKSSTLEKTVSPSISAAAISSGGDVQSEHSQRQNDTGMNRKDDLDAANHNVDAHTEPEATQEASIHTLPPHTSPPPNAESASKASNNESVASATPSQRQ